MSTPTEKIPEEFELWMRQQADKISADSPPAIQSHLYAELCVAMKATYRHLLLPTPIEAAEAKTEEKANDWKNIKDGFPQQGIYVDVWVPSREMPFMAVRRDNGLGEGWNSMYDEVHEGVSHWKNRPAGPAAAPSTVEPIRENILPVTDLDSEDCKEEIDMIHYIAEQYGNGVGWLPMINKLRQYADDFKRHDQPVESIAPEEKERAIAFLQWKSKNCYAALDTKSLSSLYDLFIQQSQK